ncbi:glycosyltransferase family 4 protein [Szabonella alba]|uniref:Glycosyltransferase family 4 protein n=1 Tax=Szabonella alba TaxID=2804194 RepID=A0A8K0Y1W0_9RHOB|nr:glycosyltransferase family 4 protein [Szabonella alba]MBL4919336.1 glycosyltransferase family 4 protein [Szabonella alba]
MGASRPHILLIGGDGGLSGVPTYLAQLMRALAGQARFTVLSDRNAGGYDFVTALGGAHVEQPGLRSTLSPLRALRALRGLARHMAPLRRGDPAPPDLVWAHARMAVLLMRLVAVWRHRRGQSLPPLAITFHGLPFGPGHRPLPAAIARHLETAFLRLMPPHHLLFLSQEAAEHFAAATDRGGHLARHRVHVIGNCSDLGPLPRTAAASGPPLVVMTGRSGYQKDHATAARILAHLPADYRLWLCGGGTDRPAFRRRFARIAGLTPAEKTEDTAQRLRFLGPLRDIRPLLQAADLFLMTSRYEGMPIAALETFEAGLPLASTDIPGMAEIVAAHPMAVTFPADDPHEAAARIVALTERARQEGPAASERIRAAWAGRFSFPVWQDRMAGLLGILLEKGQGPAAGRR